MLKARFLEGPRAPLFFLALSPFWLTSAYALAEDVAQGDLARCAAMSTDERKLACFESLLAETPLSEPAPAPAPEVSTAPPLNSPEPTPKIAPTSAVKASGPSDDFGREREHSTAREKQTVTATVKEVTTDRLRRLTFHFTNGQAWRQVEPRRFQYPKREAFDVVISRGVFGDYQLRVGGEGRMTRIRRLQ